MEVRPLVGRLVKPEYAHQVVVPSFDSLTEADKAALRSANPLTFLHAMHEPDGDPDAALAASKAGLEALLGAGVFSDDLGPAFFVYRMSHPRGSQTGLVAGIEASRFAPGAEVLPHEDVRPDLVDYLARYLRELGAASSPVKVTFRATDAVAGLLEAVTERPPDLDFGDASDLQQEVWVVTDGDLIADFARAFSSVSRAYVTDGHHRSAAAQAIGPDTPVLTVLFPDDHLEITQFNRLVSPVDAEAVRSWLRSAEATPLDGAPTAVPRGFVGVYHDGGWWLAPLPVVDREVPDSLDPSVLQTHVLEPIFAIESPGSDPRLHFVPGSVPLDELARRAGSEGVAFALAPVSVADVMAVADRGASMPAKSTYFEPKARSGVFLMRY